MTALDATLGRNRKAAAESGTADAALAGSPCSQTAAAGSRALTAPSIGRTATVLQSAAALLWIPQAALLSLAVGQIASGAAMDRALLPAAGILVLGIARAWLDRAGMQSAFRAARGQLTALRADAVAGLARRSPLDATRPSSGLVAGTLAEQAEAVVPYRARFEPLRHKATVVPLAILACVLAYSWAAALILLVAAPLIPVFMALIGWRAKEASEKQLAEMGDMNAFLLDRLRGMATIRTFDAVDRTARHLRTTAETLRVRTMAVLRIAFLSSAVLELFAALGVAGIALYVGLTFIDYLQLRASPLTLQLGMFLLLMAPEVYNPLRLFASHYHDRATARSAMAEIEQQLGALGFACRDKRFDSVFRLGGDDRAVAGTGIVPGAGTHFRHGFLEFGNPLLGFAHKNGDRNSHAALTCRTHRGTHQGVDHLLFVSIRQNHHMVLGAGEALYTLHVASTGFVDVTAYRNRTYERNGLDGGIS